MSERNELLQDILDATNLGGGGGGSGLTAAQVQAQITTRTATDAEALAGADNTKLASVVQVKEAVDKKVDKPNKATAGFVAVVGADGDSIEYVEAPSGSTPSTQAEVDAGTAATDKYVQPDTLKTLNDKNIPKADIASDQNVIDQTAGRILDATRIVDEEDLISDSATKAPSQKATKSYVNRRSPFFASLGTFRKGMTLRFNPGTGRTVSMDSGTFLRWDTTTQRSVTVSVPSENPMTFSYMISDGTVPLLDGAVPTPASTTIITSNQFDSGGSISNIPSNAEVVHRLFINPNTQDKVILLAQYQWGTSSEAMQKFSSENINLPPALASYEYVAGILVSQSSIDYADGNNSGLIEASHFGSTIGGGGSPTTQPDFYISVVDDAERDALTNQLVVGLVVGVTSSVQAGSTYAEYRVRSVGATWGASSVERIYPVDVPDVNDKFIEITSNNQLLEVGKKYFSSGIPSRLPANPEKGDTVLIHNSSKIDTGGRILIDGNGTNIGGTLSDVTVPQVSLSPGLELLVYFNGGDWYILTAVEQVAFIDETHNGIGIRQDTYYNFESTVPGNFLTLSAVPVGRSTIRLTPSSTAPLELRQADMTGPAIIRLEDGTLVRSFVVPAVQKDKQIDIVGNLSDLTYQVYREYKSSILDASISLSDDPVVSWDAEDANRAMLETSLKEVTIANPTNIQAGQMYALTIRVQNTGGAYSGCRVSLGNNFLDVSGSTQTQFYVELDITVHFISPDGQAMQLVSSVPNTLTQIGRFNEGSLSPTPHSLSYYARNNNSDPLSISNPAGFSIFSSHGKILHFNLANTGASPWAVSFGDNYYTRDGSTAFSDLSILAGEAQTYSFVIDTLTSSNQIFRQVHEKELEDGGSADLSDAHTFLPVTSDYELLEVGKKYRMNGNNIRLPDHVGNEGRSIEIWNNTTIVGGESKLMVGTVVLPNSGDIIAGGPLPASVTVTFIGVATGWQLAWDIGDIDYALDDAEDGLELVVGSTYVITATTPGLTFKMPRWIGGAVVIMLSRNSTEGVTIEQFDTTIPNMIRTLGNENVQSVFIPLSSVGSRETFIGGGNIWEHILPTIPPSKVNIDSQFNYSSYVVDHSIRENSQLTIVNPSNSFGQGVTLDGTKIMHTKDIAANSDQVNTPNSTGFTLRPNTIALIHYNSTTVFVTILGNRDKGQHFSQASLSSLPQNSLTDGDTATYAGRLWIYSSSNTDLASNRIVIPDVRVGAGAWKSTTSPDAVSFANLEEFTATRDYLKDEEVIALSELDGVKNIYTRKEDGTSGTSFDAAEEDTWEKLGAAKSLLDSADLWEPNHVDGYFTNDVITYIGVGEPNGTYVRIVDSALPAEPVFDVSLWRFVGEQYNPQTAWYVGDGGTVDLSILVPEDGHRWILSMFDLEATLTFVVSGVDQKMSVKREYLSDENKTLKGSRWLVHRNGGLLDIWPMSENSTFARQEDTSFALVLEPGGTPLEHPNVIMGAESRVLATRVGRSNNGYFANMLLKEGANNWNIEIWIKTTEPRISISYGDDVFNHDGVYIDLEDDTTTNSGGTSGFDGTKITVLVNEERGNAGYYIKLNVDLESSPMPVNPRIRFGMFVQDNKAGQSAPFTYDIACSYEPQTKLESLTLDRVSVRREVDVMFTNVWTARSVGAIGGFLAPDLNNHYQAINDIVLDLQATFDSTEGTGLTVGLAWQHWGGTSFQGDGNSDTFTTVGGSNVYPDFKRLYIKQGEYIRLVTNINNGGANNFPGNRNVRIDIQEVYDGKYKVIGRSTELILHTGSLAAGSSANLLNLPLVVEGRDLVYANVSVGSAGGNNYFDSMNDGVNGYNGGFNIATGLVALHNRTGVFATALDYRVLATYVK